MHFSKMLLQIILAIKKFQTEVALMLFRAPMNDYVAIEVLFVLECFVTKLAKEGSGGYFAMIFFVIVQMMKSFESHTAKLATIRPC